MALASKLRPSRFPDTSPLMAAITGYVFQERYTKPGIAEIAINEREQLAYIRAENEVGYNTILSLHDLRRNWRGLLDAAGLIPEERRRAERLFGERPSTLS